jgi:hypothetical protein
MAGIRPAIFRWILLRTSGRPFLGSLHDGVAVRVRLFDFDLRLRLRLLPLPLGFEMRS